MMVANNSVFPALSDYRKKTYKELLGLFRQPLIFSSSGWETDGGFLFRSFSLSLHSLDEIEPDERAVKSSTPSPEV